MKTAGPQVVITGIGPVASIGVGRDAFWEALAESRCRVARKSLAVDVARSTELVIASTDANAEAPELRRHMAFLADQQCGEARDLALALWAAELALADAGLTSNLDRNRAGMVQVFEAPGVEQTVGRLFGLFRSPPDLSAGPPRLYDHLAQGFYNMQPFVYVHVAAKALGLHAFCTSVHNACSSGAFAIEAATQQIRGGAADVMIVMGGEAFETAVRLEWFQRLGLYAKDEKMRPFNSEPSGFFVGEGGAALILESAAHAARRGVKPYATYLGGAFAHQGWKQTIPDLRANLLADVARQALTRTGVRSNDVDLLAPHGAATGLSDQYEAGCLKLAVERWSDRAVAAVFKPYFGHLLAASGLMEVAALMLCLKHQAVPAAPHNRSSNGLLPVPLATRFESRELRSVLKVSTGFTGHDAAIVFQKNDGA